MITGRDIAHIDKADRVVSFAYTVSGLVTAARLALEADAGVDGAEVRKWAAVRTLELAEVFIGAVIDGMELSRVR